MLFTKEKSKFGECLAGCLSPSFKCWKTWECTADLQLFFNFFCLFEIGETNVAIVNFCPQRVQVLRAPNFLPNLIKHSALTHTRTVAFEVLTRSVQACVIEKWVIAAHSPRIRSSGVTETPALTHRVGDVPCVDGAFVTCG